MKRFESDDQMESSVITMDEDQKLFDTPYLNYLRFRANFLKQFRSNQVCWGKFGSKDRVISINRLLNYFKETLAMAAEYPEDLESEILVENKKLVFDMNVLPSLPFHLRRELVEATAGSTCYRDKLDKMIAKL